MTNAKISEKARAVLRNKPLASAIAMALATNSREFVRNGLVVTVNGKTYTVKSASSLRAEEIQKARR